MGGGLSILYNEHNANREDQNNKIIVVQIILSVPIMVACAKNSINTKLINDSYNGENMILPSSITSVPIIETNNNNILNNNEGSMILPKKVLFFMFMKNIISLYRILCYDYASSPTSIYYAIRYSTLFGIFGTMLHTNILPKTKAITLWPIFGSLYLMLGYNGIFNMHFSSYTFSMVLHGTYLFILTVIIHTPIQDPDLNYLSGLGRLCMIILLIYYSSILAAPQSSSSLILSKHFIVGITLWIGLLVHSMAGFYYDTITTTDDNTTKADNIIDWISLVVTIQSWTWIKFGFLNDIEH